MSQLVARPASTMDSMAARLGTGSAPGSPRHTGQVWVLGAAPNSNLQPQNILVSSVVSSAWISRPMTASQVSNTSSSVFIYAPTFPSAKSGATGAGP